MKILSAVPSVAPDLTGAWNLSDLTSLPSNGLKVFSCFHCGGGSSMGYKLAGCDVLGGVEIDPKIMALYQLNHHPEHSFLMPVSEFNQLPNDSIPDELFNLDILDGSPPCSVFSIAGSREKKWGSEHAFREGQAVQRLDDLFFDFIDTAKKLKPKVVVAENVKGLIIGKAKGYVKEIFKAFADAGYDCQLFLLNAAKMGVPQRRERTFFLARRKDLNLSPIKLNFDEPIISLQEALRDTSSNGAKPLSPKAKGHWVNTAPGRNFSKSAKGSWFTWNRLSWEKPAPTLVSGTPPTHPDEPRFLSHSETIRIQTFPDDYCFNNLEATYVCGMSVPPFMIQRLAKQVAKQWLLPTEEKREAV